MNEIVFPGNLLEEVRSRLLEHSPREAGAVLLAGHSRTRRGTRLLVREAFDVPANQYLEQGQLRLLISPAFIAPLLKIARTEGLSLVFVHTHPFSVHDVGFSQVDDEGEAVLMPSMFARAPDRPHASIVLGKSGLAARVWESANGPPSSVNRVLQSGAKLVVSLGERGEMRDPVRFDRSVRALGAQGQAAIQELSVGIVGLGGTGSVVAQQLAHLGTKEFTLIDPDVIEETNLNRVVGATAEHVGSKKVDVAASMIERITPARVRAIPGDVTFQQTARALLEVDLIMCCTDSHGSRAVINQLAYQYLIATIDMGVRIDAKADVVSAVSGRVQMLGAGLPCLLCQNTLDPEQVRRDFLTDEQRSKDQYIVGERVPQPAVISLNSTVASLAATMFLSAVAGFPSDARHQILLGIPGTVRAIRSPPSPACVNCSLEGGLARGDSWPIIGRVT